MKPTHPSDGLHGPFVVRTPRGDVRIGTRQDLLAAMATTFHGQAVEVFETSSGRYIAAADLSEAMAAASQQPSGTPAESAELLEVLRRSGLDVSDLQTPAPAPAPAAPVTTRIRRPTTDAGRSDTVVAAGPRPSSGPMRLNAASTAAPPVTDRITVAGRRPSSQQRLNWQRNGARAADQDALDRASGRGSVLRAAATVGIVLLIVGAVVQWVRLSGMYAPTVIASAPPARVAERTAQAPVVQDRAAQVPAVPAAVAARAALPAAVAPPTAAGAPVAAAVPVAVPAPVAEEDPAPAKPVEEAPVAAPRIPPSTRGLQMWLPFSFSIQPGANLSPSHLMAAVDGAVHVVEDVQRHHVAHFDGHGSIGFPNPADGAFTLTCWLRTTQDAKPPGSEDGQSWRQGTGVIAGDVPGAKADFGLSLLAGHCAFGSGAPDVTLLSSVRVNDGAWHHVAAVRDGVGNLTIYIDGRSDGSRPGGLEPRDATTRLTVGSLQNGTHFFTGDLDEVRVYDRALEDDEIASMVAAEQVTDH